MLRGGAHRGAPVFTGRQYVWIQESLPEARVKTGQTSLIGSCRSWGRYKGTCGVLQLLVTCLMPLQVCRAFACAECLSLLGL